MDRTFLDAWKKKNQDRVFISESAGVSWASSQLLLHQRTGLMAISVWPCPHLSYHGSTADLLFDTTPGSLLLIVLSPARTSGLAAPDRGGARVLILAPL